MEHLLNDHGEWWMVLEFIAVTLPLLRAFVPGLRRRKEDSHNDPA